MTSLHHRFRFATEIHTKLRRILKIHSCSAAHIIKGAYVNCKRTVDRVYKGLHSKGLEEVRVSGRVTERNGTPSGDDAHLLIPTRGAFSCRVAFTFFLVSLLQESLLILR